MNRIVTGCAVLLGLTAFAAASPQIDCTVVEMQGAERALLSLNDTIFEIVLDEQLALSEDLWTPDSFCALQDDDFVAFILPVPRLPEDMPAGPAVSVDGETIEPWMAEDPWSPQDQHVSAPTPSEQPDTTPRVVEREHSLAWSPSLADEPAPSPSREMPSNRIAGGGCSTTPGESPAWWGLLALLALARRRDAR